MLRRATTCPDRNRRRDTATWRRERSRFARPQLCYCSAQAYRLWQERMHSPTPSVRRSHTQMLLLQLALLVLHVALSRNPLSQLCTGEPMSTTQGTTMTFPENFWPFNTASGLCVVAVHV